MIASLSGPPGGVQSLMLLMMIMVGCDSGSQRPRKPEPASPTTARSADPRPLSPRSAHERVEERRRMVREQIATPSDGRDPVKDQRVLDAMLSVPRHAFVPESMRNLAYADTPLPIGHDQTISQPYIVALMTQHLNLSDGQKVLEIGSGSGYQAAVLAHLTPNVYTIEIIEDLALMAERNLRNEGYASVRVRHGDGYKGWPEHAPFDAIIVTCSPDELPSALWDQLKPGGRIVIPIGGADGAQELVVVSKTADGQRRTETITAVRFVPMTGQRN